MNKPVAHDSANATADGPADDPADNNADSSAVLQYWREAGPQRWFARDDHFDRDFRERFASQHLAAARRELDHWLQAPQSALALLLLLDQYPRNSWRGTAHMFATDALALALARLAVAAGHDQQVAAELRMFFYLPFEHSEAPADQALSVRYNAALGGEAARYALLHQDIIQRFGRFPHRNAALGRTATAEEEQFLRSGGFAG